MKKVMMLGLMCLTLSGDQAVLAQSTTSNDKNTAISSPQISGVMIRKFVKRRHRSRRLGGARKEFTDRINIFQSVDVQYDEQARKWRIATEATDSAWTPRRNVGMWIKYDEPSGLLVISLVQENRNQWTLKQHPKIKVTIDKDRSTFRLDFMGNFEGTNEGGYNYNWMQGSRLLVTR